MLQVNQRVEIILVSGRETEYHRSRIEEVGKNQLVLAMPMKQQMPVIPLSGTSFYGSILNETGRYQFKSVYQDKRLRPIPVWLVTMPTEIQKIQQRSFVRLDIGVSVIVKWQNEAGEQSEQMITRDLSGGGVCLIASKPFLLQTEVVLTIDLGDGELVMATGTVIRVQKQVAERPIFLLGIAYGEII
ncbi:MAG: flagellar brake protein, partial [Sporomusaceae bacterium]|nr:flagellar brake protein [Sporomusaceae bacterium]